MRRQVVLPHPDGPTMVTNSLSRTSKLTSSSVGKSRPSRRNTRLTRSNDDARSSRAAARSWPPPRDRRRDRETRARPSASGRSSTQARSPNAPRVQRGDGRAQVGRRVRVGADQRDLGERELAHVDLARPVLQADVHDHAARLARRRAPRCAWPCAPTASMTRSMRVVRRRRFRRGIERARSRMPCAADSRRSGVGLAPRGRRGSRSCRASSAASRPIAPPPITSTRTSGSGRASARIAQVDRVQRRRRGLGERRRARAPCPAGSRSGSPRGSSCARRSRRAASCRSSCGSSTGCRGPARSTRSAPQVMSGFTVTRLPVPGAGDDRARELVAEDQRRVRGADRGRGRRACPSRRCRPRRCGARTSPGGELRVGLVAVGDLVRAACRRALSCACHHPAENPPSTKIVWPVT